MEKTGKIKHHARGDCALEHCCFHNPSEHSMRDFPMHLRTDWGVAMIERTCPHGVGHPDPDSVAWLNKTYGDQMWDIHGCDGCCA